MNQLIDDDRDMYWDEESFLKVCRQPQHDKYVTYPDDLIIEMYINGKSEEKKKKNKN